MKRPNSNVRWRKGPLWTCLFHRHPFDRALLIGYLFLWQLNPCKRHNWICMYSCWHDFVDRPLLCVFTQTLLLEFDLYHVLLLIFFVSLLDLCYLSGQCASFLSLLFPIICFKFAFKWVYAPSLLVTSSNYVTLCAVYYKSRKSCFLLFQETVWSFIMASSSAP